jgi:1-hydroxy-2-naphthoate dioxygenase
MATAGRVWVGAANGKSRRCALPYSYKWRDTLNALNEMAAAGQADPYDGVLLEYAHPLSGGPTMPTIGCWVQLIPPGVTTKPQRHTGSTIYHVDKGVTKSEKKTVRLMNWEPGTFVPS